MTLPLLQFTEHLSPIPSPFALFAPLRVSFFGGSGQPRPAAIVTPLPQPTADADKLVTIEREHLKKMVYFSTS